MSVIVYVFLAAVTALMLVSAAVGVLTLFSALGLR